MHDDHLDALPTEQGLPESEALDLLPTEELLRTMNAQDRRAVDAVGEAIPSVGVVVDAVARCLKDGGRFHGFGAGTSGRLVLLDAVECVPTFGVDPDLYQGHLAGGAEAFIHAKEGVEDDRAAGRAAAREAGVGKGDYVLAVSASGRAPWCLGVLEAALAVGARRGALVCNPSSPLADAADDVILAETGPEVLAGSTRLKAGTAQKMVLNMISTAVMVRLGRTFGHWMVGVRPTNAKLRRRAERLIARLAERTDGVGEALDLAEGDVRLAVLMLKKGCSVGEARRQLDAAHGSLRRALDLS
ncbi:MAG TPA: N-acetylmuramic acid 6-phosphate etherase [Planctomycetes bacterium]|nr:N-acetylmuramic acid 6-phosphate etherase [Planctomycetota bacterium]